MKIDRYPTGLLQRATAPGMCRATARRGRSFADPPRRARDHLGPLAFLAIILFADG